jgi:Protein of unknown function (DUF2905)
MPDLSTVGKALAAAGILLAAVGGLLWAAGKIPFLGRLPGDIRIQGDGFKFYFPLATCLLVSAVGSLILWILSKLK